MAPNEDLNEFDAEIKADRRYGQILVKITDFSSSDKEAMKVIEGLGINIVSKSRLSKYWALFALNVEDVRGVALELTERGFIVKGINAVQGS